MRRGEVWWYERPDEKLTERITELSPKKMHEICRALDIATDC